MVVLADTSPLNYLVLIEATEVLPRLYRRVTIPSPVLEELLHPDTPPAVADWAAWLPSWVNVIGTRRLVIDAGLAVLDAGESAAIALAQVSPNALLLMDDVKGRREAALRNIQTIGTLDILRDAAAIDAFDLTVALSRLRNTNFRAPAPLFALLKQDAERKKNHP